MALLSDCVWHYWYRLICISDSCLDTFNIIWLLLVDWNTQFNSVESLTCCDSLDLKASLRISTALDGSTYFRLEPTMREKRCRSSCMKGRFLCSWSQSHNWHVSEASSSSSFYQKPDAHSSLLEAKATLKVRLHWGKKTLTNYPVHIVMTVIQH